MFVRSDEHSILQARFSIKNDDPIAGGDNLTRDDRIFLTHETTKMTENSYDPYKGKLRKRNECFV
jgi:hypothetical protein